MTNRNKLGTTYRARRLTIRIGMMQAGMEPGMSESHRALDEVLEKLMQGG